MRHKQDFSARAKRKIKGNQIQSGQIHRSQIQRHVRKQTMEVMATTGTNTILRVLGGGLLVLLASACAMAQTPSVTQSAPQSAPSAVVSVSPAASKPAAPLTSTPTSTTATGAAAASAGTPQLQTRAPRYEIHAGDSFDVNFDLSPEFNQPAVVVQPDGYITLRAVGDIKVDGQTVPQLAQTLRKVYSKILHDPIISVVLKDFEKPYFIADGQIGRPGKYDLRGTVTLTQALAIAGGLSDSSKHSQVMLFRRVNDQWVEAKLFNVKKMEKTGNLDEDPYLHPGDMVFVPKNFFSKISRFIPQSSVGTMVHSGTGP
jgi:polysaccharide biosynthesis/export protein